MRRADVSMRIRECPLSVAKRKCLIQPRNVAIDPDRTSATRFCRAAHGVWATAVIARLRLPHHCLRRFMPADPPTMMAVFPSTTPPCATRHRLVQDPAAESQTHVLSGSKASSAMRAFSDAA